jgi:hypothetical protein
VRANIDAHVCDMASTAANGLQPMTRGAGGDGRMEEPAEDTGRS